MQKAQPWGTRGCPGMWHKMLSPPSSTLEEEATQLRSSGDSLLGRAPEREGGIVTGSLEGSTHDWGCPSHRCSAVWVAGPLCW